MNTLTYSTTRQMTEYTPRLRELQWSVENWQRAHAEAGLQKSRAWELHKNSIDVGEPHEVIEQYLAAAEMYEVICAETWREWESAKARLLALLN